MECLEAQRIVSERLDRDVVDAGAARGGQGALPFVRRMRGVREDSRDPAHDASSRATRKSHGTDHGGGPDREGRPGGEQRGRIQRSSQRAREAGRGRAGLVRSAGRAAQGPPPSQGRSSAGSPRQRSSSSLRVSAPWPASARSSPPLAAPRWPLPSTDTQAVPPRSSVGRPPPPRTRPPALRRAHQGLTPPPRT